ncbi:MAG: FtsQ-type POTRA domain-containing protein [Acidobacteriota bacterium]
MSDPVPHPTTDRTTPTPLRLVRPRPSAEAEGASVLPFRRRPAGRRIRRLRRSLLVRLAKPAAIALLLVATPMLGVAWLLSAPQLALQTIDVRSAGATGAVADGATDAPPRVAVDWLRAALAPFEGVNLWRLDLEAADAALRRHPWVDSVALTKKLPSTLVVQVVERREVALWRGSEGIVYIDADGRPIAPWQARDGGVDLPILSGELGDLGAGLALLRELAAVDPAWLDDLSEIEILGQRDARLHGRRLPFPLLVRAGMLDEQLRRLDEVLPTLRQRWTVAAVDLRFSRRIVVRPESAGAASGTHTRKENHGQGG